MSASSLPLLPGQRLTAGVARLATRHAGRLSTEPVQAADIVITMGCGDACPVVPGRRYLDWPVADPDGAPLAAVRDIRDIRDAIDAHITELLSLLPARTTRCP